MTEKMQSIGFSATLTGTNQGTTVYGDHLRQVYRAGYHNLSGGGAAISGAIMVLTLYNRYGTSDAVVDQAVLGDSVIQHGREDLPLFTFAGSSLIRAQLSSNVTSAQVLVVLGYRDEE